MPPTTTTLDEYVRRLIRSHPARREYDALKAHCAQLSNSLAECRGEMDRVDNLIAEAWPKVSNEPCPLSDLEVQQRADAALAGTPAEQPKRSTGPIIITMQDAGLRDILVPTSIGMVPCVTVNYDVEDHAHADEFTTFNGINGESRKAFVTARTPDIIYDGEEDTDDLRAARTVLDF